MICSIYKFDADQILFYSHKYFNSEVEFRTNMFTMCIQIFWPKIKRAIYENREVTRAVCYLSGLVACIGNTLGEWAPRQGDIYLEPLAGCYKARCNKENGCRPSAGTGRREDYPNRHYLSLEPCAQVPSIYLMIGSAHTLVLFAEHPTAGAPKRRRRTEMDVWWGALCRSHGVKRVFATHYQHYIGFAYFFQDDIGS